MLKARRVHEPGGGVPACAGARTFACHVLRKYADGTYRNLGLALWALARSFLSYRPSRQQNAALVCRALGYG